MTHAFDVDEAKKFGLNAAIILDQIRRWIAYNKANGKNDHEGRTWTFNSVKAWAALAPYFSSKQVRSAIDDLVAADVLIKGNFNGNPNDRTLWYALGDGICPTGQIVPEPLPCRANGNAPDGKCVDQKITKEEPKTGDLDELKAEANRFVDWFVALLSRTGAPEPRLTPAIRSRWADSYEKLRRIDGKEKPEIVKVCEWVRADGFWRDNFFSPVKLRDRKDGIARYDLFLSKLNSPNNGNSQYQRPNPRLTSNSRVEQYVGFNTNDRIA